MNTFLSAPLCLFALTAATGQGEELVFVKWSQETALNRNIVLVHVIDGRIARWTDLDDSARVFDLDVSEKVGEILLWRNGRDENGQFIRIRPQHSEDVVDRVPLPMKLAMEGFRIESADGPLYATWRTITPSKNLEVKEQPNEALVWRPGESAFTRVDAVPWEAAEVRGHSSSHVGHFFPLKMDDGEIIHYRGRNFKYPLGLVVPDNLLADLSGAHMELSVNDDTCLAIGIFDKAKNERRFLIRPRSTGDWWRVDLPDSNGTIRSSGGWLIVEGRFGDAFDETFGNTRIIFLHPADKTRIEWSSTYVIEPLLVTADNELIYRSGVSIMRRRIDLESKQVLAEEIVAKDPMFADVHLAMQISAE
jgi:hypothetical protein